MRRHVGELEQMILLAILRSGDEAYAPGVRRELRASAARSVSRATLYRTLERMHKKGFVRWVLEPPAPDQPARGNAPLRRFAVTATGLAALRESRASLLGLWAGLESILDP